MPARGTIHAIDYLEAAQDKWRPGPVCALFGDEAFLKRHVLRRLRKAVVGEGEGDLSLAAFEGASAALPDVLAELATLALFGSGKRLVIVEEADSFVTRYRSELEAYVARPKSSGVLVLDVASWPANTRLFKAVASVGLQVECTAPTGAKLNRWLCAWAKGAHGVRLAGDVAEQLVDMVGPELGLLDQELAKLALSVGVEGEITSDLVARLVGTWRAKTAWEMLDAALDGDAPKALTQLDRLILSGEHPIAILAQISSTLRRFAAATRLVLAAEAAGRRVTPRSALEQAGVKPFVLERAERRLRRLGRHRGAALYRWLVQADLGLKGESALPARTVLEQLLVRLSAPTPAPRPG